MTGPVGPTDGDAARPDRTRAVRLHQLEGFFHVARHGGYARAAAAMDYPVTEPALHQQVRKLERALGVSLLARGAGRRMTLTSEGRALLDFVSPYFERLPGVIRAIAAGESATIVVGTEPLYADGLCSAAFASVRRDAPAARLRLVEMGAAEISPRLLRGEIDVGVGNVAAPADGVVFEKLGVLGLTLLVPAGHPLARARKRRAPIEPRDLSGRSYVLYLPGTAARAFTDSALAKAGLAVDPAAEASSASAMTGLVRAGVAPAFLPALGPAGPPHRRTLPDGTLEFDLTPLLERVAGLPRFGLFRRAGSPTTGIAAAFFAAARRHVAERAARRRTRRSGAI